jgi:two-component system sensor histidine kinase ChvG
LALMTELSGRGWESDFEGQFPENERRGWRRVLHRAGFQFRFTSLAGRIIVLNLFGLAILVGGILYLNQFREGLIEARAKSLQTQGEIIASAIAQNSAPDSIHPLADPEPMIDLPIDAPASRADESLSALAFRINPEQITPLLHNLIKPTSGARARIYDREGNLLMDTSALYSRGQIMRFDLPSIAAEKPGFLTRLWLKLRPWLPGAEVPLYEDIGVENGKAYEEVMIALNGAPTRILKVNAKGETIICFAVPIQRMRAVFGALLMTTRDGEIDAIIAKENAGIMRIAFLVVAVTLLLSTLLAGTIAGPMRRLAGAAERVRQSIKTREQIPDFSDRKDEIGHLSRALRDMTSSLYSRIDAIESFAADVAHELKNPLTSLRSAAETLPLVRTDEDQKRLIAIIQHDVRRLDRLITDISDASRLDAELAREACKPVNLAGLLDAICSIVNDIHRKDAPKIVLKLEGAGPGKRQGAGLNGYMVNGHDSRLSQVINNILDNAMSFSPKGGRIYVSARRLRKKREIEVVIEDEGPGISPENLEKIFNRFYTDRPGQEEFGQNSGLGLHISRQIIEAHGGRIWAENRKPRRNGAVNGAAYGGGTKSHVNGNAAGGSGANGAAVVEEPPRSLGARFVIRLPAMPAPAGNSRA